jgi:hypothetical protein
VVERLRNHQAMAIIDGYLSIKAMVSLSAYS